MQRISPRAFALAVSLIMTVAAIHGAPRAAAQTGPGWVSLFDGKTIGSEWDRVGETNWRVEDGAIVADKRTSETLAHLVTKTKYKDFQVYVEFWASDDANSGIYIRCSEAAHAATRRWRDQVPQGCGQAAVAAEITGPAAPKSTLRAPGAAPVEDRGRRRRRPDGRP